MAAATTKQNIKQTNIEKKKKKEKEKEKIRLFSFFRLF